MQWILRFRVYIIISLAVLLISAAVVFSVLRAVLPYATGYKNEIQQEISQQIGLPVKIKSIDAAIHWFSPRLKLIDVVIYDEKNTVPLFNFKEAFVELDVLVSLLRQELIVDDVGLIGADISIRKLSDVEWEVQGVKFTSEGSSELPEQFLYMLRNSDYLLHDSNIYYQDLTENKLNIALHDVNIEVENNYNNHDIKFSMNLPEAYGGYLAVVANLHGDMETLAGDVYIEAQQLKVNKWNQKFNLTNEYNVDAILDIDVWATLDESNITALHSSFVAENFSVKNNATKVNWATSFISSNVRYVFDDEHWNVAVSDFYFGEELSPEWSLPISLLVSDDSDSYYLSADFIRFDDLQKMSDVFLSKDLLADSEHLKTYEIHSDIYNLNVRLPKDMSPEVLLDKFYLDATVVDLSLNYHEENIRLSGLDASFTYDNHLADFNIISEDTEIDIADLFRDPLFAETIHGSVALNYDVDSWKITSDQLHMQNDHINTFSRLDVRYTALDGYFTDIKTNFYDADTSNTKHYLPVGIMSSGLVRWLDMAVTDGYVPNGEFVLYGDLNKFPYNNNDGVFQVLFSPENFNMRFLKEWPLLEETSANIKFNSNMLEVKNVQAKTLKAILRNSSAVIADLTAPHLVVSLNAESNVSDIQSYILNSPLEKVLGGTMKLLQFDGNSNLNLGLELPLNKKDADVSIDGHLNFYNSEIYYPALGYEINDINGVIDFTENSIFADSIKANVQGNKVMINAVTQNGMSGQEAVFNIGGVIPVDYLLQQYKWIPEHWLSGKSRWAVGIEIPYKPKDYLVHIEATSDMENIVAEVSDKVKKKSNDKINLTTTIDVMEDDGLQINVTADLDNDLIPTARLDSEVTKKNLFEFNALRVDDASWELDIKSDHITGSGFFVEGLTKDAQIKLDLDSVDLHALFVNQSSDGSDELMPNEIPSLELSAKKILWDNLVFTQVNLLTNWHKHGMLINEFSLNGPSMNFEARGTWLTSWRGSHETVLQGKVSGNDIGAALAGLGFEKSIDRSEYDLAFNSKWSAEPYALTSANVKGETSFQMGKGQLLEVEPGAGGRLLGLLNIFQLANRLALDFNDVTRKGFSFDSIDGEFEFGDGDGSLKKFDVSAPAADINMFGSIGLVKRDYGLLMRVKPHTDTLTFAGGALLGGVAVGAGLALIQKVFDLGVLGHNVYSITGNWDSPEVEKIVEKTLDADSVEDDDF